MTRQSTTPKDSFNAALSCIHGEDPAELEALTNEYHDHYRPLGPVERYLVNTIIQCDWKRRRLVRAENEFLRAFVDTSKKHAEPLGSGYEYDVTGPNILRNFFRQQAANERSYYRAMSELERLQQLRQPVQPTPAKTATAESTAHPQTGAIGFIPKPKAPPQPQPTPATVNLASKAHPKEPLVFVR